MWGEDDELTTRMLDDAYQGRGAGGSPWPEDTRAVVSASCGRADENDIAASGSNGAGADSIALGRIVVTKQSEIRALTREEERREQEEAERRRRKGGAAGRNSRHGSRNVTGGVVMTTTTTMTTNDAESDTSRTTAEGSRREGSTDGIILAPGPAHMV